MFAFEEYFAGQNNKQNMPIVLYRIETKWVETLMKLFGLFGYTPNLNYYWFRLFYV